jgi:hypothetical protein
MASMFNSGLQLLAADVGGIKWDDAAVVIYGCLVDATYIHDPTDALYSDLSGELANIGYVAGGIAVTGRTCTLDTPGNRVIYDADDCVFVTLGAGTTPTALVTYRNDIGVPKTLLSYNSLTLPPAPSGSNYTVVFSATTGVFTITNV